MVVFPTVKIEQLYRAPREVRWRPLAMAMHCVALPTSTWLCYKNLVRATIALCIALLAAYICARVCLRLSGCLLSCVLRTILIWQLPYAPQRSPPRKDIKFV